MGTLRSDTDQTGAVVNGVTLGTPVGTWVDGVLVPPYLWDDSAFPTGTVETVDGAVVVTPDEVSDGTV